MIPKIIHCFWAQGPKTKLAEKCLASWRKYAPDWEIFEWNLENLGVGDSCSCTKDEIPSFVVKAIAARKWAMVSDYVRMRVLKEFGGIYLDLDVELVKPIGELPDGEWVAGEWTANGGTWMNPGSGIALVKDSPIARAMLERYDGLAFDPNREMMTWINESLRGLTGLKVLDPEVMSPIGIDGKLHRTARTVGIHWYAMSWASPGRKIAKWLSWHGLRPLVDALLSLRRLVVKYRQ